MSKTQGSLYGEGIKNSLSLLELFSLLEELLGVEMRYEPIAWRPGDQRFFVADYSQANHDFGWRPTVGKEQGLQNMLAWTQESVAL